MHTTVAAVIRRFLSLYEGEVREMYIDMADRDKATEQVFRNAQVVEDSLRTVPSADITKIIFPIP